MIALDEAQARLLALVSPLPPVEIPLHQAAGYWAAADIVAKRTQPARPLSAMDGYAVAAGERADWTVIGESAAGRPFEGAIGTEDAIRIFTGAALPEGADSIIVQENVTKTDTTISIDPANRPRPGQHVRAKGSDFSAGDVLIAAGEHLTPARIALAASGGHGSVPVRRRPRITLLATGDELVPPGEDAGTDLLPESNSVMVAAMLRDWPCDVEILPIAPDRLETLASVIGSLQCDVLITMGGASVGDHDLVKPALEQCGARLDFWKVAMRPGKPVMAGMLGSTLALGLPGNPVSAFVTTLLFAMPAIARLCGARAPLPQRETIKLGAPFPTNGLRTDHIRARMTGEGAVPVGPNDSAGMGGLAGADILVIRPPGAPSANPGDMAEAIRII